MIKGGYILQPRLFDKSDAAHMSPVTRELWYYLLRNVNFSDGESFKRGQNFFTLKDIQDGLSWFIGYRKSTYSKPQLTKALRRLREATMIETTKATRGVIVTVCNYSEYQNPKNYEGNAEGNTKETKGLHYKQEGKEGKNKPIKTIPPKLEDVISYCGERSNAVDAHKWFDHYTSNGWLVGKNKMKDWKAAVRTWERNTNLQGQPKPKANTDAYGREAHC
jgi:hypothetical protein